MPDADRNAAVQCCLHCRAEIFDIVSGCYECRSPSGKLADLRIAIEATGDTPDRILEWPKIRYLLRKRYGADHSDEELWELFRDWLIFELGLIPDEYLHLRLSDVIRLLQDDFEPDELKKLADGLKTPGRKVYETTPNGRPSVTDSDVKTYEESQEKDHTNRESGENLATTAEDPRPRAEKKPKLSLLERYPASDNGHVRFIEFVRDEVSGAAAAKRRRSGDEYSVSTLERMVRGILWLEARDRAQALSESGITAAGKVLDVLVRELSVGTVERIDELLKPAVRRLRNEFEKPQTGDQLREPIQLANKRPKRSTAKGDAKAKIVGALTHHHNYADGGCLNCEPISVTALAAIAGVAKSSVSKFLNDEFGGREKKGGHAKYKNACSDSGRLAVALKLLNGEFAPHELLYGPNPPEKKLDGRTLRRKKQIDDED